MNLFRLLSATLLILFASSACADWGYDESVDESTGEKTVYAHTKIQGESDAWIHIQCSGFLGAMVALDGLLNPDFAGVAVTWRVDEEKAVSQTWSAIDRSSVFLANNAGAGSAEAVMAFASALIRGHNLSFHATSRNGSKHTAEFSLKGSSNAIKKVFSACGM